MNGQIELMNTAEEWKAYKQTCIQRLVIKPAPPHDLYDVYVQFGNEPETFPCLVSSFAASSEVDDEQRTVTITILSNSVGRSKAVELLRYVGGKQSKAELDSSLKKKSKKSAATVTETTRVAPSPTGVLVLAMMLELKAIGALKTASLVKTTEWASKWLMDNADDADRPIDRLITSAMQDFENACK